VPRGPVASQRMVLVWLLVWFIAGKEPLLLHPVNAWTWTLILAVGLDLARVGAPSMRRRTDSAAGRQR
jgi:hypothetical protein